MKRVTIDELVQKKVAEELAKYDYVPKPAVSEKWKKLRKEISYYCDVNASQRNNEDGATTIKDAIYKAIRWSVDIHRINEMSDEQAESARNVFEFIKNERALNDAKAEKRREEQRNDRLRRSNCYEIG